ncbi:MAG TPA: hypothetical protein VM936_11135 [Pyrinomonadaceae bacterium]|nr:hypothetical protein [Pyrinomonadaceae bacterium]
MGVDIVGWRACPMQSGLGPEGFLRAFKLRAYKAAAERLPADALSELLVRVHAPGRGEEVWTYQALCDEVERAGEGIPECETCPISEGRRLGCYRYVSYPLDEHFERLLFTYFGEQVTLRDSACEQLYRDVVSAMPRHGLVWHTRRGEDTPGALAELDAPLRHAADLYFDSAQLCAALFTSEPPLPLLIVQTLFWGEFAGYVRARVENPADSRTLGEVLRLPAFYQALAASAIGEGGTVLIDA